MGDFNKVADVLKDPEVVVENPELGLSYPIVYYGRQTVAGIQALLAGNPGQTYEQKLSAADRFDFKKVQEARRKDKELKRYRDAARIGYIAPGSTTFITSPSSVPNSTPSTPTTPVDPNLLPLPIITDPDFEDINLDSDEEDKKPLIPVVPSPAPDVVTSRPEQEPEIVNEDNPRDDVPLLPRRRPGRGGRGGRGRRPRTRRPRGPRVPRVPAPSFDGGLAGVGGVLAGTVALVATGVTVSTIGLLTGDGPPPPTYVGPDGTPALPPVTIPPDTIPDLSPPPQQPLLPAPPQVPQLPAPPEVPLLPTPPPETPVFPTPPAEMPVVPPPGEERKDEEKKDVPTVTETPSTASPTPENDEQPPTKRRKTDPTINTNCCLALVFGVGALAAYALKE